MSKYIDKRIAAFGYAFKGIGSLLRNEAHAKIHLCAAILVIAAGFIFNVSSVEWCILLICIGGVFMAEAFNTAIEKLADRVSKDRDPLIGAAKDIAAGAVLLFVLAVIPVGLIIFIPKILSLF